MTTPPTIASIGSCLSNLTAAALEHYGYSRRYFAAHTRSDGIVRYFIERTVDLPPREDILRMIEWRPEFAGDGRAIVENQYPSHFGYQEFRQRWTETGPRLLDDLRVPGTLDLIMLDNFSDIYGRLLSFRSGPFANSPINIPLHMTENFRDIADLMETGPLLTAEQSAANWRAICLWLQRLQPDARIVFNCFTYSATYGDWNQTTRAIEFGNAIKAALTDLGVIVVPPLGLLQEHTNPAADWSHFIPNVYRALAGHIWLRLHNHFK